MWNIWGQERVEKMKLGRLPHGLMGNGLHCRLRARRQRKETKIMWEREARQKGKGEKVKTWRTLGDLSNLEMQMNGVNALLITPAAGTVDAGESREHT